MSSPILSAATAPHAPTALSFAGRLRLAALAAVLGLVLLYGAGLATPHALHSATHDARHAAGFPCH